MKVEFAMKPTLALACTIPIALASCAAVGGNRVGRKPNGNESGEES